jgi:hypothetical protein
VEDIAYTGRENAITPDLGHVKYPLSLLTIRLILEHTEWLTNAVREDLPISFPFDQSEAVQGCRTIDEV